MTELSDYKRLVEAPMIAGYEATIKELRRQRYILLTAANDCIGVIHPNTGGTLGAIRSTLINARGQVDEST